MPSNPQITQFKRNVIAPLERVGRALKRYALIEGLCLCAAMLVGMALIQFTLDRLLILGMGPRALMLVVVIGVIGHQLYNRVIRPVGVRVGVTDVAAILERRNEAFRDQLISAVAFVEGADAGRETANPRRNSPALVQALIQQANDRFQALPTQDVLKRDRHLRYLALGAFVLAFVICAFAGAPETMATYVARNLRLADEAWPVSTRIEVEGFDENGKRSWPIGDELTLVATALDKVPPSLRAEFSFDSGRRLIRNMDRRGRNQFLLDFGPLTQAMKVRFMIGKLGVDERTRWYEVEAVHRPAVKSVRIEVTPPAYAEKEPFVLPQGQASADIIRGSAVRIDATISKPVVTAALKSRSDERLVAEATIENGTHVTTKFVPDRTGTFYFDVLDHSDLDDRSPVTYSFNLMTDPAPKSRLTLPGVGELVVSNAELNLAVDCEDNLGLQSATLVHRIRREQDATTQPAQKSEFLPNFVPKQLRYSLRQTWPLLPLTLKPGDQLTLQVLAADYQPPVQTPVTEAKKPKSAKVSHVGESLAYTLRIVTAEELLAELGRREHEWRQEFERIIKSQEQLNRRIMDLRDSTDTDSISTRQSVRFGQEARTQRQQIGRLKTIARQFEQILNELKVNQLATPTVRRRLQNGVVTPLKRLINTDIVAAAELIERLRYQFDEKTADELEQQQAEIVRIMYGVRANMLKWEGYNETIVLLRDILRLQKDVNKDTQSRHEREIEKLFGSPEPEGDSDPEPEEKP